MILKNFRNIPFRMQDLSSVFPNCVNLKMKAKRLEHDGDIIRLKRGLYVTSPKVSHIGLVPFLLANNIYGPSYVSMQTALRYYGLIPEAVYSVQSMTTGVARDYENAVGIFNYIHVPANYYTIGVTMKESTGATFMIATPEKALCDLMVFTPNLNLRFQTSMRDYLEEDIRFDMDALINFDLDIIKGCAEVSRKKTMLNQLIKFIENERNI
jgi:phage terminase large subunit-like protein